MKKKKNFFDCSLRNKYKQKALIVNHAQELSEFGRSVGLKINEIILTPNNEETNSSKMRISVLPNEISQERIIFYHLMAKDISFLSNLNYRLQRRALLGIQRMPGIKKVLKLQHELNRFFEIKQNSFGYFCSPEQKIKYVCGKFLLREPNFSKTNFKIKLSIDSTTISTNNLILLNVSFNLIDDVKFSMNINGTYILGSFEIEKEEYKQLKECLNDLLRLLETIENIKIGEKLFKISFYLGCDYKMIRILYGHKAANSLDG